MPEQENQVVEETPKVETPEAAEPEYIEYDDFAKVQLRTGKVLSAERVPKADKLLLLKVDTGSETRQILAGLAQQFEPESLIGKTVIVVVNLKPRKLRGYESQGMLLAASPSDDAPPSGLLTVDADVIPGSIVR
jgi:methionyl-tRNA synthetase